jgi:hypothetical protein
MAVLNVLKAGSKSRIEWEVAISVWMELHENPSPVGVMLLKQEADRTKDPAIRQHLGRAAYNAVDWCTPADHPQCKAVLDTRFAN